MAWKQQLERINAALRDGYVADMLLPDGTTHELTAADLPVVARALQAVRDNETAWIGFKAITDAQACMQPLAGSRFSTGSANAEPFAFFVTAEGGVVCGHPYNDRDRFQMLDVTRGPAMHTGEFAGLAWTALPLKQRVRVVIFGAGEVSRHLANFAHAVDFDTVVLDFDDEFLNAKRFPTSALVPVVFTALEPGLVEPADFACVLTRSHTYDVEALAYALKANPAYVGMIGHPDKIRNNYDMLKAQGIGDEAIGRVHAPIGIKCGGRTPAEIAVSIVAELIQERKNLE